MHGVFSFILLLMYHLNMSLNLLLFLQDTKVFARIFSNSLHILRSCWTGTSAKLKQDYVKHSYSHWFLKKHTNARVKRCPGLLDLLYSHRLGAAFHLQCCSYYSDRKEMFYFTVIIIITITAFIITAIFLPSGFPFRLLVWTTTCICVG